MRGGGTRHLYGSRVLRGLLLPRCLDPGWCGESAEAYLSFDTAREMLGVQRMATRLWDEGGLCFYLAR